MNYYLVEGRVRTSEYMRDTVTFNEVRLVKATSPKEAEEKYEKYWESKSSDYEVSYYATATALETIE